MRGGGWQPIDYDKCAGERYYYYLDGDLLGQQVVESFEQQPLWTFAVPSEATEGIHEVKVELWVVPEGETEWKRLQCRKTDLEVASSTPSPWITMPVVHAGTGEDLGLLFSFDPSGCDIPPCDKIHLVQVLHPFLAVGGVLRDATDSELLTYGGRNGLTWVYHRTNGVLIDQPKGSKDPYLTGNDPRECTKKFGYKKCNGTTRMAECQDGPHVRVPPGFDSVVLVLELRAFCAAGQAQGEWLGTPFVWKWTVSPGSGADLEVLGNAQAMSLGTFQAAFNKFNAIEGFRAPAKTPPRSGGRKCD